MSLSGPFSGLVAHEPRSHHRRSEPLFTSSATHSTWCVIGNRSKARSASQPVAVLGEDRDVAGQRGRVAGDVGDRARRPVDDLLDDRAAGALARRVEDDEVEGLVVRRGEHARRRRRPRPWRPRQSREVGRGRAGRRSGRPRPRPPGRAARPRRRGTARTARPRRRGRAPAPPAAAPASPARSRPAPAGAPGCTCQKPSAVDREVVRPPVRRALDHGPRRSGRRRRRRLLAGVGARDQAVVDRDDLAASGACASPAGRRGRAANCTRVRQRRPSVVARRPARPRPARRARPGGTAARGRRRP